jgi:hypothetical protein
MPDPFSESACAGNVHRRAGDVDTVDGAAARRPASMSRSMIARAPRPDPSAAAHR